MIRHDETHEMGRETGGQTERRKFCMHEGSEKQRLNRSCRSQTLALDDFFFLDVAAWMDSATARKALNGELRTLMYDKGRVTRMDGCTIQIQRYWWNIQEWKDEADDDTR